MTIETLLGNLQNYGVAGMFIIYLVYDRQVLLRKVVQAIDKNTQALRNLHTEIRAKR